MRVYTVGHSSREIGEFISLLKAYGIELLLDVRSYPRSSRFPHFNRDSLEKVLRKEGIEYLHVPQLGGFRKGGYSNYTKTEEFKRAIHRLIEISKDRRTAIMCAEKDWRNCHRKFIAEELTRRGIIVVHLIDIAKREVHPSGLF